MAIKKHLPEEQIRQIHDAAIRAGLSSSRNALLGGVDPGFVMSLPNAASPSAQLLIDLMALNQTPTLMDGTTPLLDWLGNASLLAGPRHEADVFRVALATIKPAASGGTRGNEDPPRSALPSAGLPPVRRRGFEPDRFKCFVAYAPQDERFARDLLKHLSTLERTGVLSVRHSGGGLGGDPLSDTLALVGEADAILFMVSADLFADETAQTWIDRAIERAGRGVRVVPVLTRHVDLTGSVLRRYRALPASGDPITSFKIPDEAYADIAREVRALAIGRKHVPSRPAAVVANQVDDRLPPRVPVIPPPAVSAGTMLEPIFVEPAEMATLAAALSSTTLGLVVQGPSGSGKTTVMRKLIPEPRTWLNCVKPGDVESLREFLKGKPVSGHLVIDEFHEIDGDLRRPVANLIKSMCDEPARAAKITVIGVNDSGASLFQGNTNLAGRVNFINMRQRQPRQKIEELVEKRERAANVRFTGREALVVAARGSFIVAQQLCSKALSTVVTSSRTVQDVDVDVGDLAALVAADLVGFRGYIVGFVRQSAAHLVTLWMLARKTDDSISLHDVRDQYPEHDSALDVMISQRASGACPLRQYLHIDPHGRVICDDVQLMFYLARLTDEEWRNLAQDAGRSVYFKGGILQVARTPPQGGPPRSSILDLDVAEFWVRPEANELLSTLCAAYDTIERVSLIAHRGGVSMHDVIQTGSIRDIWFDLLRVAIRTAKLRTLVNVMQSDPTLGRYRETIHKLTS